jgi:hypothetical protein
MKKLVMAGLAFGVMTAGPANAGLPGMIMVVGLAGLIAWRKNQWLPRTSEDRRSSGGESCSGYLLHPLLCVPCQPSRPLLLPNLQV